MSEIVPRKEYLNEKVGSINDLLKIYCKNMIFLSHDNINAKEHCKSRGLHLNSRGESIFFDNYTKLLDNLDSEY